MTNAAEARDVVFELFQDLDRFSLDDYAPLASTADAVEHLVRFVERAAQAESWGFTRMGADRYLVEIPAGGRRVLFSTDRDAANADEALDLLGLDHPSVAALLEKYRELPAEEIGVAVRSQDNRAGVLGIWSAEWPGVRGQARRTLVRLAVDGHGSRIPPWEHKPDDIFFAEPADGSQIFHALEVSESALDRELQHRGGVSDNRPYLTRLVGWVVATA
jgi:hypothetical protein